MCMTYFVGSFFMIIFLLCVSEIEFFSYLFNYGLLLDISSDVNFIQIVFRIEEYIMLQRFTSFIIILAFIS